MHHTLARLLSVLALTIAAITALPAAANAQTMAWDAADPHMRTPSPSAEDHDISVSIFSRTNVLPELGDSEYELLGDAAFFWWDAYIEPWDYSDTYFIGHQDTALISTSAPSTTPPLHNHWDTKGYIYTYNPETEAGRACSFHAEMRAERPAGDFTLGWTSHIVEDTWVAPECYDYYWTFFLGQWHIKTRPYDYGDAPFPPEQTP